MCGVAGIFHYAERDREVDVRVLKTMTRTLVHRGPDDEGFYVSRGIGLGHRRLSIVDLTPTGHQPMSTEDCRSWITYNGEFYNHNDFRVALAQQGIRFRGTSDTETLLYLMASSGPEALAGVAAIFAFAYWDEHSRTLTLARDPLGVKQLYYYDDGCTLWFASEIKALLAAGVPRAIDFVALNQYLHFHTPLFERTFFKDIWQLLPGEFIVVGSNGRRRQRYWQIGQFETATADPHQKGEELQELLQKVVADQLMADVPVGAFFSGGIDSTAAAEFAKRAGKRPQCFGIYFSGQGVIDERPYQEAAARALGLDLELMTLDGSSFADDFLRLTYYQDQPVIGPALVPMYHVSRLASRKVKVCLGGQGADEIFGGYARYALSSPMRVLKNALWPAPAADSDVKVGGNLRKQLFVLRNLRRLGKVAGALDWKRRYFENFAVVSEREWHRVFADPGIVCRRVCHDVFDETVNASPAADPGDKVMHWDVQTYLPGLFQQDDRMSMANSLESRVPLADPRVVRFAFRLGFDLKFRDGASKWILRQALAPVIPAEVLNRRKVGFDTPVQKWIGELHRDFARDLLTSSAARSRGLWNSEVTARLLDDRSHHAFDILWKVISIEAWARQLLDASPAAIANFAGTQREPDLVNVVS